MSGSLPTFGGCNMEQTTLPFDDIYRERCLACGEWTSLGVPDFDCLNAAFRWAEGRRATAVDRMREQMAMLSPVKSFQQFKRGRKDVESPC
jgi:hypothetical protein